MTKKDFDFYIGNKMSARLPDIGADIFSMYAVCKQLHSPELESLTLALKQASNALKAVHEERAKLHLLAEMGDFYEA